MLYDVRINQQAVSRYSKKTGIHLNYRDISIFNYLFWICTSVSDKVTAKRINIDERVYTWINYKHLIKEMPMLSATSTSTLSNIIQRLEKAELIETKIKSEKNGRQKYVRLLSNSENFISDALERI